MIFYFTPNFHHEDWRTLTQFLNQQEGVVAMPSLAQNAPLTYYNLTLPMTEIKNNEPLTHDKIYYIRYVEDLFDPAFLGRDNLVKQGYTIDSEIVYAGLKLEVYEK